MVILKFSREGETMNEIGFTFSDTIAGYVTAVNTEAKTFDLKTTDDRDFRVQLTDVTYGEVVRNLGEPFQDLGMPLEQALKPGKYLFAYGIFYPENNGYQFEAKHIIFVGRNESEYRFESPDWWIKQIRALAE